MRSPTRSINYRVLVDGICVFVVGLGVDDGSVFYMESGARGSAGDVMSEAWRRQW